jgi:hypothetical protein
MRFVLKEAIKAWAGDDLRIQIPFFESGDRVDVSYINEKDVLFWTSEDILIADGGAWPNGTRYGVFFDSALYSMTIFAVLLTPRSASAKIRYAIEKPS